MNKCPKRTYLEKKRNNLKRNPQETRPITTAKTTCCKQHEQKHMTYIVIKETAGTGILPETSGKSEPVYPSRGIMLISQRSRHIMSVVETYKRLKRMLFI